MAKGNKYSEFDNMSGKLGRRIISKNRYGPIVYEIPEYVNKQTPGQVRTRISHKEVMALWRTLSPKEIYYISLRASNPDIRRMCYPAKILTAYLLFYHLKRNLQEIGIPISKEVKEVESGVQYITDFKVELKKYRGKPGLKVYINPALNKDTRMIIYATHCLPGGLSKPKASWYRIIKIIDHNFKSGSFITADYLQTFNSIDEEAMSIYFKFKTVNAISGMSSNPEITEYPLILKEKS